MQLLKSPSGSLMATPERSPLLVYAFGVAGRPAEAKAVLQTLEKRSRQRYIAPVFLAWVHIGLGQRDAAFARLEEAYWEGSPGLLHIKADPPLEPLRTDPGFGNSCCG